MFLIIRTLEFSAFTFGNIGILNFAFSIQCDSVFYLFQTLDFPLLVSFSRHWNSMFFFCGILDFGFLKKLKFSVLHFANIAGIQEFCFSKNCISVFSLIQTLEFWILAFSTLAFSVLAFPNIGIVNFGFSKHWSSGFWRFQHCNLVFWFFQTPHVCKKNVNCKMFG